MAEKSALIVGQQKGVYKITWEAIGTTSADDTGAAVHVPGGFSDVTIQVLGTFAGSTLTIQGSNDGGTTWTALNDSRGEGNAMAFTAANLMTLNELPLQIRPVLTSGSSSDLDVIAIIRKRSA